MGADPWAGVVLVYEWYPLHWRVWRRAPGIRRWVFAGVGAGPVAGTTTLGHAVVHRPALPAPSPWALLSAALPWLPMSDTTL
jgi:hypothetical protein